MSTLATFISKVPEVRVRHFASNFMTDTAFSIRGNASGRATDSCEIKGFNDSCGLVWEKVYDKVKELVLSTQGTKYNDSKFHIVATNLKVETRYIYKDDKLERSEMQMILTEDSDLAIEPIK